jgi:alkylation response protein AidB-like acyl-CoA dehydrogenase
MDFALSKEQQELQKEFGKLCCDAIAPGAAAADQAAALNTDNIKKIADVGYFATAIPEEFGGRGQDLVALFALTETLAAACPGTAMAASTSAWLCNTAILKYGSAGLKKILMPALAKGEQIGGFALSEPGAGSDINAMAATATKDGDCYKLEGVKGLTWNAAAAHGLIVFARTGDGPGGQPALSAFAVEKSCGYKVGAQARTLGLRGAPAATVDLAGCRVSADALLGEEGKGWDIAMDLLDYGRLQMAAMAIGISTACFLAAKAYAEDRSAFGKPIGVFQEVAFKAADIYIAADVPRLLTNQACWRKQNGEKCSDLIASAKLLASQKAVEAAHKCLQIFGGVGYTQDAPAERLYRDARFFEIGNGTTEIMRQVICKDLLGPDF